MYGLTEAGTAPGGTAKAGPRHLAFHPTLRRAFSSDESGNSITAYGFDKGLEVLAGTHPAPAGAKKDFTGGSL